MTTLINGSLPTPKQIRFVNNQGQPPSKRRRVNAACLTCRKRKTRCAGEKPVCSTCSKNGHVCLGFADVAERKPHSGRTVGFASERSDAAESSADQEDDYADEEDETRRHWKSEAGRSASFSSQQQYIKLERRGSSATMSGNSRPRTDSHDWQQAANAQLHGGNTDRQTTHPQRKASAYSEDSRSSNNRSPTQHHTESHRVPYFRYFGPTAIVPGFKQMVVNVSVRDRRRSRGGSFSGVSPNSFLGHHGADYALPFHTETIFESLEEVPAYDPNDSSPVDPLIVGLVKTFFQRLGCNYPFLREERTLRMLEEKRLEPMLVDSICALAARFTELAVATRERDGTTERSQCGHVFAQRAKAATVDTFPCPSVGAVQACLLMAYEGFGENQDSTLWMYLGLAIRMAVDLGLQKMVGVRYQGEKDPWYTRTWVRKGSDGDANHSKQNNDDDDTPSPEEQQDIEQERIDTFWAVFVLDRVIASGTGRPVTFRDDDFELALPEPTVDPASGYPAPFPHFIRIIHLYGRVSDVLNKISSANDLTEEKMSKLAQMESDLTQIYQNQDPKLNFSAQNFQAYVKAGQGTTFILLHFWFHALIIVLHQPTLAMPVGSFNHTQLLPNSHELAMSSAKTISDILAFADLIDPNSFIGNPFTSQPMYIAACAFLMESAAKSVPPSREPSPYPEARFGLHHSGLARPPRSAKHLLLTTSANQNYQRCYKSLQHLHDYWSGVQYILTALDQRSKGIWDCETYTNEELEKARLPRRPSLSRLSKLEHPASPNLVPMALSLTGTTNSPNPSLTLLFQNNVSAIPVVPQQPPPPTSAPVSAPTPPGNMIYDPVRTDTTPMYPPPYPQPNTSAVRHQVHSAKSHRAAVFATATSRSYATYESRQSDEPDPRGHPNENRGEHMHGGMSQQQPPAHSYTPSSQHSSGYEGSIGHSGSPASTVTDPGSAAPHHSLGNHHHHHRNNDMANHHAGSSSSSRATTYHGGYGQGGLASSDIYPYLAPLGTEVITLGSQELPLDMDQLGLTGDLRAEWLEYLPGDVLEVFGNSMAGDGQHHMG